MKKSYIKKCTLILIMTIIMSIAIIGCGRNNTKDNLNQPLPMDENTNTPMPEEEKIDIKEMIEITEPEVKQDIDDEFDLPDTNPHPLQIVFLGETNLDAYRNDTGIAYLVGFECDARIYNLSIGGSTVAVFGEEDCEESQKKNSQSLVGMTNILAGKASVSDIEGTRAAELIRDFKVEETDYFVIMYGAQDFIRGIPLDAPEYEGGIDTYVGALRKAIENLREVAPLADFVLCAPHYSQFFDENGVFIGDGHVLSNGHSFLFDYKGKIEYVANEQKAIFLNAFQDLGIDGYTAADFLDDGVHLSERGRKIYAQRLSKMILDHEKKFYN